jgi:L-ribulose-5-phosphate 3-epimerase
MESTSKSASRCVRPPLRLTIMQGRLLPPPAGRFQCFPRERWPEEFAAAKSVPLDGIEWIYDLHGAGANPLESEAGLDRMRELGSQHGIAVCSLCADYFMDLPLLRVSADQRRERLQRLDWLIGRCGQLGIQRIVLPFVDASRIETPAEADVVVECLHAILPTAEACKVELHLETALGPAEFAALLARLNHPFIKVNYDSGNSASLGYHPHEEFHSYGSRVGSVHIKDRVRGGGTVPLGTGSADFAALRQCLAEVNYQRDFVLQVARGESGAEVEWARHNRRFVLDWWSSGGLPAS